MAREVTCVVLPPFTASAVTDTKPWMGVGLSVEKSVLSAKPPAVPELPGLKRPPVLYV
jgi:hypothetical protein